MKINSAQRGSSLIEIVVATGVMALVLTAIVAGMTLSLKTNADSEYRSQSVQRAQEAIEVFRRERALLGWEAFVSELTDGGTYCLQTLPAPKTAFTLGECSSDQSIVIGGQEFYRQAVVDLNTSDPTNEQAQVTVTMTWNSGGGERSVDLVQVFRKWE